MGVDAVNVCCLKCPLLTVISGVPRHHNCLPEQRNTHQRQLAAIVAICCVCSVRWPLSEPFCWSSVCSILSWRLHKFAKSDRQPHHGCPSVRIGQMNSRWANFREILYGGFALRHTDRQIHVWLKWTKNNRRTARACGAESCRRTQNTQLLFCSIPRLLRFHCKKHDRAREAVDNMTSRTRFTCRHARYALYY